MLTLCLLFRHCTITGEVEVDLSLFIDRDQSLIPYSIGLALTENDASNTIIEWNQDGPGNYNRPKSFIRIHQRLVVDLSCYVKFTIRIPSHLLPAPSRCREFSLVVKTYALENAFLTAEPTSAPFMVFNPPGNGRRGSIGKL